MYSKPDATLIVVPWPKLLWVWCRRACSSSSCALNSSSSSAIFWLAGITHWTTLSTSFPLHCDVVLGSSLRYPTCTNSFLLRQLCLSHMACLHHGCSCCSSCCFVLLGDKDGRGLARTLYLQCQAVSFYLLVAREFCWRVCWYTWKSHMFNVHQISISSLAVMHPTVG